MGGVGGPKTSAGVRMCCRCRCLMGLSTPLHVTEAAGPVGPAGQAPHIQPATACHKYFPREWPAVDRTSGGEQSPPSRSRSQPNALISPWALKLKYGNTVLRVGNKDIFQNYTPKCQNAFHVDSSLCCYSSHNYFAVYIFGDVYSL